MTILDRIEKYAPCAAAREWLGSRRSVAKTWADCPEGRWMMWLLGELHVDGKIDRKALVVAACAVARTLLRHVPDGEDRPRVAIETAERWCRGEATIKEVRDACSAAWDCQRTAARAAGAAASAADASAADAAAYAADAADAAAYAAAADAIRSVVPASVIERALDVGP